MADEKPMRPGKSPRALPLEGVRVLDIATMIAAPFCAAILAEFGAEVIKVELPGRGEGIRHAGIRSGTGSSFMWLSENRNKKCITLDLRKPEGAELLKRLIAQSDIVVENFRPGTLEKWGLGYEAMQELRPDIILVRVSAYGQTGPYREWPGYARIAHAFAGLSYLAGEADGRPVIPGSTSLADYIAGLYAALGALLAFIARRHDGQGQSVDVSLYEGVLRMFDDMLPRYAKTGFVRQRMGPDTINQVPHSHYLTRDGQWIALACSDDRMWQRMTQAMGRPELGEAPEYARMSDRIARLAEVNALVQSFIGTMERDALLEHCRKFGVPIGPINSVADIFKDPHIRARGNLLQTEVPGEGPVVLPNVLPRLTGTPGEFRWAGARLGEHNEEIYRQRLGLGAEEMQRLKAQGVI